MIEAYAEQSAAYYAEKLRRHGATFRGVDWNSAESQERRFAELLRIAADAEVVSLNDYGCGYGALVDYLRRVRPDAFDYVGYDASAEMIDAARLRFAGVPRCAFTSARTAVTPRDYTVASGVFNVKLNTPAGQWWDYVVRELASIADMSARGFAFNMLTSYSDPERRRDDLFYADPEMLFGYCMRHFSRSVALLHDYPLYEFTVLVRL
jgi:SAM-dependent methyltransferase